MATGRNYIDMGSWFCYLCFCFNQKEFEKETKRLTGKPMQFLPGKNTYGDMFEAKSERTNHPLYIISVSPRITTIDGVAGVIAHEASHVADRIFAYIGEEKVGTETRAYLIQHIVVNGMMLYRETVSKKGRK